MKPFLMPSDDAADLRTPLTFSGDRARLPAQAILAAFQLTLMSLPWVLHQTVKSHLPLAMLLGCTAAAFAAVGFIDALRTSWMMVSTVTLDLNGISLETPVRNRYIPWVDILKVVPSTKSARVLKISIRRSLPFVLDLDALEDGVECGRIITRTDMERRGPPSSVHPLVYRRAFQIQFWLIAVIATAAYLWWAPIGSVAWEAFHTFVVGAMAIYIVHERTRGVWLSPSEIRVGSWFKRTSLVLPAIRQIESLPNGGLIVHAGNQSARINPDLANFSDLRERLTSLVPRNLELIVTAAISVEATTPPPSREIPKSRYRFELPPTEFESTRSTRVPAIAKFSGAVLAVVVAGGLMRVSHGPAAVFALLAVLWLAWITASGVISAYTKIYLDAIGITWGPAFRQHHADWSEIEAYWITENDVAIRVNGQRFELPASQMADGKILVALLNQRLIEERERAGRFTIGQTFPLRTLDRRIAIGTLCVGAAIVLTGLSGKLQVADGFSLIGGTVLMVIGYATLAWNMQLRPDGIVFRNGFKSIQIDYRQILHLVDVTSEDGSEPVGLQIVTLEGSHLVPSAVTDFELLKRILQRKVTPEDESQIDRPAA